MLNLKDFNTISKYSLKLASNHTHRNKSYYPDVTKKKKEMVDPVISSVIC